MRAPLFAPLALMIATLPATAETVTGAYHRGFTDGVAAVNAQLGAVTAQMQRDVQAQVNAQLAELDARRTRELEARLAEAQGEALADQGAVSATGAARAVELSADPRGAADALPGMAATMPALPPLTRAPGGGIAPKLPARPDPRIPADPSALPAGTTITITDPQNLPPELFRALMTYATR